LPPRQVADIPAPGRNRAWSQDVAGHMRHLRRILRIQNPEGRRESGAKQVFRGNDVPYAQASEQGGANIERVLIEPCSCSFAEHPRTRGEHVRSCSFCSPPSSTSWAGGDRPAPRMWNTPCFFRG